MFPGGDGNQVGAKCPTRVSFQVQPFGSHSPAGLWGVKGAGGPADPGLKGGTKTDTGDGAECPVHPGPILSWDCMS